MSYRVIVVKQKEHLLQNPQWESDKKRVISQIDQLRFKHKCVEDELSKVFDLTLYDHAPYKDSKLKSSIFRATII